MPLAELWISSSTLLVPASNALVRTSISAGAVAPNFAWTLTSPVVTTSSGSDSSLILTV